MRLSGLGTGRRLSPVDVQLWWSLERLLLGYHGPLKLKLSNRKWEESVFSPTLTVVTIQQNTSVLGYGAEGTLLTFNQVFPWSFDNIRCWLWAWTESEGVVTWNRISVRRRRGNQHKSVVRKAVNTQLAQIREQKSCKPEWMQTTLMNEIRTQFLFEHVGETWSRATIWASDPV